MGGMGCSSLSLWMGEGMEKNLTSALLLTYFSGAWREIKKREKQDDRRH
jgi:hypothetical protein